MDKAKQEEIELLLTIDFHLCNSINVIRLDKALKKAVDADLISQAEAEAWLGICIQLTETLRTRIGSSPSPLHSLDKNPEP